MRSKLAGRTLGGPGDEPPWTHGAKVGAEKRRRQASGYRRIIT
jgi:hypothetical protein